MSRQAILLAPIGALGGVAMPVHRWQPVSSDAWVRVGVAAAVSVRF